MIIRAFAKQADALKLDFVNYLVFLKDNKNKNVNLVSESVYNSLKNKKKLTVDDIKSFI